MPTKISELTTSTTATGTEQVPIVQSSTTKKTTLASIITDLLTITGGAAKVGADDGSSGTLWTTVQGFISKILSSAGASVVGFIQAGTGAVNRTVQEKGREEISRNDFSTLSQMWAASVYARKFDPTTGKEWHNTDPSPLDYSTSRAGYVWQHRDSLSGGTNELIPGAVFQFNSTGSGTVDAATELSQTIWQGLYSFMNKTGDASAHSFTSIGQLGAYGVGGYNELGLFQGEGTNVGSALGTITGVEILLKDSPDAGATTYSTKMQAVVGRIAKYDQTVRKSYSFYASSEGTLPPNAILGGNPSGLAQWQRGFDFEGLVFTTGQFGLVPNNTSLAWMDSGSVARPVIGMSDTNVTYLRPGSGAATIDLQDFGGTTRFQIEAATGFVAWLNATLSVSATAGTNGAPPVQVSGYLNVKINGTQYKLPYYNV